MPGLTVTRRRLLIADMESQFLPQVLVLLIAAVVIVFAFERLRLSPVLGYIVAGAAIGPYGLKLISGVEETRALAELGIVFLLFMIGLELPYERLAAMRRYVLGLGVLQVAITGVIFGGLARWLGQSLESSVVIGVGLALSSTAIALQLLVLRGEQTTPLGRASIAILITQDLLVVPMLVLIPGLGDEAGSLTGALGEALLQAAVVLAAIILAGRLLLRHVFRLIARARQAELLTATALVVILGTAAVTAQVGLSLALGAFIAGLLLAESEYRHHVEADIAPFRGILLGLFFMTVGMSVDIGRLPAELSTVAALVAVLLAVKAAVLFALVSLTRLGAAAAVRTALLLCQGGEFAFIMFTLAIEHGVMAQATYDLLILVVGVTMAMTPGLAWIGRALARHMMAGEADRHGGLAAGAAELEGHVVILGFGRVGQTIATMLKAIDIPYVAVDLEPRRVIEGRARGLPVFYADASRPQVLRRANVERACAAVVAVDNPANAVRVVDAIRRAGPEVGIYARARDRTEMQRLEAAGATVVIPDTLEASLQLGGQLLSRVGMSDTDIDRLCAELRTEGYGRLADMIPARTPPAAAERTADAPRAAE